VRFRQRGLVSARTPGYQQGELIQFFELLWVRAVHGFNRTPRVPKP
jgi:hypothetical protein